MEGTRPRRRPISGDLPGTGGIFKESPEDFEVEEIPAYEPCGSGDHLFLWVEKRDLSATELIARTARAFRLPIGDVGSAGRKDRRAVTRQYLSVPFPPGGDLPPIEGARILRAERHANKLRTGHLRGNRFRVVVRGAVADAEARACRILSLLAERGLPNRYGPQRFGGGAGDVERGLAVLAGRAAPPRRSDEARFLVSAAQADLFNAYLDRRIERGAFERPLAGDLMKKAATGGMFLCDDPEREAPRMTALEIHPTGPIYGARMRWPAAEALALEEEVLAGAGLDRAALAGRRRLAPGSRREIRVVPGVEEVAQGPEGLVLRFALPAGSYATVLLEEVIKAESAPGQHV